MESGGWMVEPILIVVDRAVSASRHDWQYNFMGETWARIHTL
jgi:hypothetical protein